MTITGSGFVVGDTTVTIGGNTVTPTAVTPTQLTFTTPAHAAGAVDVTVATTDGGSSDPPLTFTYVAPPTITTLLPNAGTVDGGDLVTVNGTGFVTGQTTVTIGATTIPAAQVTVLTPTQLTFTTPPGPAGPADVVVSTPDGGPSAPATFTYFDAPTATSITPNAGPVVGGNSVTVVGTGFAQDFTSFLIAAPTGRPDGSRGLVTSAAAARPRRSTCRPAGTPARPRCRRRRRAGSRRRSRTRTCRRRTRSRGAAAARPPAVRP